MKNYQKPTPSLTAITTSKGDASASTVVSKQSNSTQLFSPKTEPKPTHSRRLHRKLAAGYVGCSLSWLDKARLTGTGPLFISVGSRIVYDTGDLDAFMEQNRHRSTSEYK